MCFLRLSRLNLHKASQKTGKQTGKQAGRQAGRQIDRQTQTYLLCAHCHLVKICHCHPCFRTCSNPVAFAGPFAWCVNMQRIVIAISVHSYHEYHTCSWVNTALTCTLCWQGQKLHPLRFWWLQLSTDQVAKALRVSSGALVQSVGPNSAAAKAGLLPTRRGLTGIVTGAAAMSSLY